VVSEQCVCTAQLRRNFDFHPLHSAPGVYAIISVIIGNNAQRQRGTMRTMRPTIGRRT